MNQTAESTITLRVEAQADAAPVDKMTAAVQELSAAEAELSAVEKQAVDTKGHYLDRLGRLHAANGAYVSSKTEEGKAIKAALEMTQREAEATGNLNRVAGAATVTANGLVQAKERATRSTANAGQAMLTFGRAAQDAQYGIGGVINNVEGLVTSLGLSAGLAGVISVVAVGLQIAVQNFDIFGTKAAEAAEKAKEHAKALEEQAAKTKQAAADSAAAAESTAAMTAALEAQSDAMARLNEQLAISLKLKAEQRRLDLEESAAGAEAEMAKIDADEKAGRLSPQAAAVKRNEVQKRLEQEKFDAGQAARKDQEAAASARAAEMEREARLKDAAAGNLRDRGRGLLTGDERASAKAEAEAAAEQRKIADEEAKKAEDDRRKAEARIRNASQGLASEESVAAGTQQERAAIEAAKQKAEEAARREAEAQARLEADRQAQLRTGQGDAGKLQAEQERLRREAEEARREANGLIVNNNQSVQTRERERGIFERRQETREYRTGAEVDRLNREQMDRANEERARETKERERREGTARKEFRDVQQAATAAGANEEGLKQMDAALTAYLNGSDAALKTFVKLAQQLAKALPEVQAAAEEARAAAEAVRSGR